MFGPRRLDGGLLPIAEVAATVFQEDLFTGTPEQHASLMRRVCIGRNDAQIEYLTRARHAFEQLDTDRDGGITSTEGKVLVEAISRSGGQHHAADSYQSILRDFDSNGDGRIGFIVSSDSHATRRSTAVCQGLGVAAWR